MSAFNSYREILTHLITAFHLRWSVERSCSYCWKDCCLSRRCLSHPFCRLYQRCQCEEAKGKEAKSEERESSHLSNRCPCCCLCCCCLSSFYRSGVPSSRVSSGSISRRR